MSLARNIKALRLFNSKLKVRSPIALRAFAPSLLLLLMPAEGRAAVDISFYSREFGANFPHAFVGLAGTGDRTGQRIGTNYGFTATHIGPAIRFGAVKGEIFSRDSQTDARYRLERQAFQLRAQRCQI